MTDNGFLRYVPAPEPRFSDDFYIGVSEASELYVWKGRERYSLGRVDSLPETVAEDPFLKLVLEIKAAEEQGYRIHFGLPPDVERLRVDIDTQFRPLTKDELGLITKSRSPKRPESRLKLTERLK
jgi:hypothetical protein